MDKGPSNYIYLNARGFYEIAALAYGTPAILELSSMAIVANFAMCVELLLKCSDAGIQVPPYTKGELLSNAYPHTNIRIRGHALDEMFDKIKSATRERLEELYQQETTHDLRTDLIKCKDYFQHARYAYERGHAHSYDIGAIKRLADGLSAALLRDWGPAS